jgi:hypothetical protein
MTMVGTKAGSSQTGPSAQALAAVLTATPSLRAAFFANPTRDVGKLLPPPRYWVYETEMEWWQWLLPLNWWPPFRHRNVRGQLAKDVLDCISEKVQTKELSSSINTDSVFAEYFAPIVKVSERTYASVYILSWAAFLAGVGLIAVGAVIGFINPSGVNSTVLASVFGGTGAVSALGSVLTMSVSTMRLATSDLSSTRLVLTAFATQLGQLRGIVEGKPAQLVNGKQVIPPPTFQEIDEVNKAIGVAMTAALLGMPIKEASANGSANDAQTATGATNGATGATNGATGATNGTHTATRATNEVKATGRPRKPGQP